MRTDAQGRAQGSYFNCTLTSCFQPIRKLASGIVLGHEGFARSHADTDPELSVWRLLDQAASDDELVELDRLCRVLHVINFFRQRESASGDLYLSVHPRLLAAVAGDHGRAFSHVLELLGLPRERIVLLDAVHNTGGSVYAQGFLLDLPNSLLAASRKVFRYGAASAAD